MIPIRDENPTRTTPYVVYGLIILNLLAFVIDWLGTHQIAPGLSIGGLWNYSMIPREIITGESLPAKIAGQYGIYLVKHASPQPVWITIFTSMFLHGGLWHIGGNMLYLWIFGNNIEDVLGHVKFFLFYMIGGVAAAAAHIMSNPMSQTPTIGASGAIAAILGAYIVLFPTNRIITLVIFLYFVTTLEIPAVVVLGLWFLLQFASAASGGGMTPGSGGVAYWAHIGGFVFGMAAILLLGGKSLVRQRRTPRYYE